MECQRLKPRLILQNPPRELSILVCGGRLGNTSDDFNRAAIVRRYSPPPPFKGALSPDSENLASAILAAIDRFTED